MSYVAQLLLAVGINVAGVSIAFACSFAALSEPFADLGDYSDAIGLAVFGMFAHSSLSHLALWALILVLADVLLFAPLLCAQKAERQKVVETYLQVSPIWIPWLPCLALLFACDPSFNFYRSTNKPAWLVSPLFGTMVVILPLAGLLFYRRRLGRAPAKTGGAAMLAVKFSVAFLIAYFGAACAFAMVEEIGDSARMGLGLFLVSVGRETMEFAGAVLSQVHLALPFLVLVLMLILPAFATAPRRVK